MRRECFINTLLFSIDVCDKPKMRKRCVFALSDFVLVFPLTWIGPRNGAFGTSLRRGGSIREFGRKGPLFAKPPDYPLLPGRCQSRLVTIGVRGPTIHKRRP